LAILSLWVGQAASLAKAMPAADVVRNLIADLAERQGLRNLAASIPSREKGRAMLVTQTVRRGSAQSGNLNESP